MITTLPMTLTERKHYATRLIARRHTGDWMQRIALICRAHAALEAGERLSSVLLRVPQRARGRDD